MEHFWRKPVRLGNHIFIGQTMGYWKPWGDTVKFDCYLIDSCGRSWSKAMIDAERQLAWKWN
jgi:hypothetical protein